MRRIAVISAAAAAFLAASCNAAGPLDPPAATPAGIDASMQDHSTSEGSEGITIGSGTDAPGGSTSGGIMMGSGGKASVQSDSTPRSVSGDIPAEGSAGGIMIGSGT